MTEPLPHRPARPRHRRLGLRRAARRARRRGRARSPAAGPLISGVLTRSRGDFDEILAGADLVVELIGGIDPARDYVLAALRARQARRHRQQAAARPARRGAVRRPRARAASQLRFEAAVAGVVPVDPRAVQESLAGAHDRARPRDRQRHDQLHPHARWPRTGASYEDALARGPGARLRRGRPDRGRRRRATPRRRWRSSRGWRSTRRCTSTRSPTRASSRSPPTTSPTRRSSGSALKLLGTAERVDGGHQRPRASRRSSTRGHPLAQRQRPVQRGHGRVAGDHRDHAVGPGRRRPADRQRGARRRRLAMIPAARRRREATATLRDRRATSSRPSTCTSRSPTGPACSRRSPRCSALRASRSERRPARAWATTRGW